jgi:hypothetical protein
MTGVIEEPLVQFPLTKAVILLLNLPAKDYLRTHVIDLLSSLTFNSNSSAHGKDPPAPRHVGSSDRELAICKSDPEWRRLNYATRDLILSQVSRR